jgi:hypothetical protein
MKMTSPRRFVSQEGSSDTRGNDFHPERATLYKIDAVEFDTKIDAVEVSDEGSEEYKLPNVDGVWSEEDLTDDGCCFSSRVTAVHDDAEYNDEVEMEDRGENSEAESTPAGEQDGSGSGAPSLASAGTGSGGSPVSKPDNYLDLGGERFSYSHKKYWTHCRTS